MSTEQGDPGSVGDDAERHLEGLEYVRRLRSDRQQMVRILTDNGADGYQHLSFTPRGAALEELRTGLSQALLAPAVSRPKRLLVLPPKEPEWWFRVFDPFGEDPNTPEQEPLLPEEPTSIAQMQRQGRSWDVYEGWIHQTSDEVIHRDLDQHIGRLLARVALESDLDLARGLSGRLAALVEELAGRSIS